MTGGNPTRERRVKLFFLHPTQALNLLNLGHSIGAAGRWDCLVVPRLMGLPDDAYVSAVHYDHVRAALCFRVDSMEFEPVEEGHFIPEMEITLHTVVIRPELTPA
jgi:hypothetical protein